MKKLLKFSLVLAVVLTASTSFAGNVLPETTKYAPAPKVSKPMIVQKDHLVTVSILFANTPVAVKVMEQDGTEIYSGKFDSQASFVKKFDISEFPKGTYLFEFNYNNTTFTEVVKK